MARKQIISPPEEGSEAPEFNLPVAQGGQLRLGLRTARGPVIVIFYRGPWSEECVAYFKALAEREREINVAGATLVGVGPAEPEEAREFVRESGFKSYLLYDYIRRTIGEYGLLQKDDPEHGYAARPAAFLIGKDHEVIRAWLDDRPAPEDLLAEVSKITGLPKEPEEGEAEEKPKRRPRKAAEGETAGSESEGGEKSSPKEGSASSSGDAEAGDSGASQKETAESAESTAESTASAESTESAEESETSPAASEDAATAPEGETKSPESSESPGNAGDTDTGDSSGSSRGGEGERSSMPLEEGSSESESGAGEGGSEASTEEQENTSPERGESGGDGATSSGEDR